MKAKFSEYLDAIAPQLKQLVTILGESFTYVSVLATDAKGLSIRVTSRSKNVSDNTLPTERGIVVRVAQNNHYSEYAFNSDDLRDVDQIAEKIISQFALQESLIKDCEVYETGILPDEPYTLFVEKDAEVLPEEADTDALVNTLHQAVQDVMAHGQPMMEAIAVGQSTHISKIFLSKNRDLRQSYVISECMIAALASDGTKTTQGYKGVSGIVGPELFTQIHEKKEAAMQQALDAFHADSIVPGEYEIITSPEVSGLIAHEAFGHGVEMDMFVKKRALGAEYIDKRVASDLVSMHEGALCADDVASYAFDDEGVLAHDVTEIDHGILKTGICDALSALRLGIEPTGNGKREGYAHKVYTRMTNTIFSSGESSVDEMIASVKYGYLLEGMQSGMEDPKHWGIQCIISLGREIKDGKLTGKVVSPVLMTGYVPDLLGNVSMVSTGREVFGNGACGKGHKEWVKVSDGGPYLKTKGMLG